MSETNPDTGYIAETKIDKNFSVTRVRKMFTERRKFS